MFQFFKDTKKVIEERLKKALSKTKTALPKEDKCLSIDNLNKNRVDVFLCYVEQNEPFLYESLQDDIKEGAFRDTVLLGLKTHTELVGRKFPEHASKEMLMSYKEMLVFFENHGYRKVMEEYIIL